MKQALVLTAIVSISLNVMPASAKMETLRYDVGQLSEKDCPSRFDSLPERISRLEREIAKGEQVYTQDELTRLDAKLTEAKRLLRSIVKGGSGK